VTSLESDQAFMGRQLYIRICRDSNFNMGFEQAAALVAGILGISSLEVAGFFPYIETT